MDHQGTTRAHIHYRVVALIALPVYYAINKDRDDRHASLTYGLLCLFLAVMSLRAMVMGAEETKWHVF
jgi:hypothetical protein